jgi:molybdopterin-guanine dinucleotide biosynthesis protein A
MNMLESYNNICADVTLAILVGGQSRRMGVSKSHLQIDGVPILEFLFKRLMWPGPTLLVDAPGREKPPGHELFHRAVTDPTAGEGPLRGVLTALEQTMSPFLVVIPVDMPCMTTESLASLVEALKKSPAKSLAMFRCGGRLEPLPAAFAVQPARLVAGEQVNSHNTSIHGLTEVMNSTFVLPDPSWPHSLWVNLNRPVDVEEYLRRDRIGVAS